MNKIYKPSILRILTNSTFNCIAIVFFIIIGADFFNPNLEQYILITGILLEIFIVIVITFFTIKEYKFSYLELNDNTLTLYILSSRKKCITLKYEEIKEVKAENFVLKIYYDDKKLTIDYFKEYKELKELIQKKMN